MSDKVVQLKDREGNKIFPIAANTGMTYSEVSGESPDLDFPIGTILGYAECWKGNVSDSVANGTIWTEGNGTNPGWERIVQPGLEQYQDTTYICSLTVQAPDDEDWTVLAEGNNMKFNPNNDWGALGICYRTSTGTIDYSDTTLHWLTDSIYNGYWGNVTTKAIVTISAGTHKQFFLYNVNLRRSGTGQKSAETTRPNNNVWVRGPGAALSVTLLKRSKNV